MKKAMVPVAVVRTSELIAIMWRRSELHKLETSSSLPVNFVGFIILRTLGRPPVRLTAVTSIQKV